MNHHLDDTDKALLRLLQVDSAMSLEHLAQAVHLSKTPCWRRIKRLKDSGYITQEVALLDAKMFGYTVRAFILLEVVGHDKKWRETFVNTTHSKPNILEVHRLMGVFDYMLVAVFQNIEDYDRFYRELTRTEHIKNVSAHMVMQTEKHTHAMPIV